MGINPIGSFDPNAYTTPYLEEQKEARLKEALGLSEEEEKNKPENAAEEKQKKRLGIEECETCKNRKYQDSSDEMVSFKTAQHVSPESAGARVRAHEGEHVSNAYKKAAQNNGKVIQASVVIHTAICPECGRTYVSGGETTTQIKYYNEDNPYQKDLKQQEATKYAGLSTDYRA